jgi:hypothetical protein
LAPAAYSCTERKPMKQNMLLATTLLAGVLAGAGLTSVRLTSTAHAAPIVAVPAASTAPLAEMLGGKTYPRTLKAEQVDSAFHLLGLIDAQGQSNLYATRGETVAVGGETFMVCYSVATTNSPTRPPQPKAGATANLVFINLRAVQALGGIVPIAPPETIAPAVP